MKLKVGETVRFKVASEWHEGQIINRYHSSEQSDAIVFSYEIVTIGDNGCRDVWSVYPEEIEDPHVKNAITELVAM